MSLTITCPDGSTARAYVSLPGSFTQRITKEIQLIIPDDANALTFTFDIYDGSEYPRYSISGLAKNTNHMILVERLSLIHISEPTRPY